jgi:hypothetical protein
MTDRVRTALQGLVDRLDEIAADPDFKTMATLYYTHLGDYRGPTWVDALKEAKSALREGGEANQEKPK